MGPKGNSLKRLQEETMTKMAILGKGSMREKVKVRHRTKGTRLSHWRRALSGQDKKKHNTDYLKHFMFVILISHLIRQETFYSILY